MSSGPLAAPPSEKDPPPGWPSRPPTPPRDVRGPMKPIPVPQDSRTASGRPSRPLLPRSGARRHAGSIRLRGNTQFGWRACPLSLSGHAVHAPGVRCGSWTARGPRGCHVRGPVRSRGGGTSDAFTARAYVLRSAYRSARSFAPLLPHPRVPGSAMFRLAAEAGHERRAPRETPGTGRAQAGRPVHRYVSNGVPAIRPWISSGGRARPIATQPSLRTRTSRAPDGR